MRVTIEVSYDTDEPEDDRDVTRSIMTVIATALPYMADNVEVVEIDGGVA